MSCHAAVGCQYWPVNDVDFCQEELLDSVTAAPSLFFEYAKLLHSLTMTSVNYQQHAYGKVALAIG